MNPAATHWPEANQRHLMAALAVVREALQRHAARAAGKSVAEDAGRAAQKQEHEAACAMPAPSALETLSKGFGLTAFERDVLLLCAGMELDSAFAALCAEAQGDGRRPYATFSLALAALPQAHWSALTPDAPLRYWRLIELGAGESLTASPLRVDERILHYLTGVSRLDERLQGLLEPLGGRVEMPDSYRALAHRVVELWSRPDPILSCPVIQLCGAEPSSKRAIAATACTALGIRLHALRAADIPLSAAERDMLRRLLERETLLSGSALLLDADDLEAADHQRALRWFLERLCGAVIVSSHDPMSDLRRPAIRLDVPPPRSADQHSLWRKALGPAAASLNGQLDAVVQQFRLSLPAIHATTAEVLAESASAPQSLWDACRAQARPRLDDLAQRIESAATWDDLVLPELQLQILREIAVHVRQRACVYERWGFAARGGRGLGISALFAGASGTGKTMAAEVLANELRLDLYRIDLSQVVSKYIGETEKNLRRVFDAAEEGGAILLFDEADALFGKRSEVKDSHDRYANIEISYLLQRMEGYRGLAILTTNLKSALDPGFLRRLRFVVEFPFPDVAHRAEIWRRIFPASTPTESLDAGRLAQLNIPGGNIRNIALHAAFLAADAGEPVRMSHLLCAARREYAKLERSLSEVETGGWK